MRTLIFLTFLMSLQAFALAPECPIYANKNDCIKSVDNSFEQLLDLIKEQYEKENQVKKNEMIEAAKDIKHYESLACLKTCLN